jgi:rhodanese-related sulfurtransferase
MRKSLIRAMASASLLVLMFSACATSGNYDNPGALAQLISSKSEPYTLIDVRTAEEYAAGHIPSAINIPVATLEKNLPTEDRSSLLILYCSSGIRSKAGMAVLERLGFTRIVDFVSVDNWKGALVTGNSPSRDNGS